MRRSGMERTDVASRMVTFLVLLYGVYMGALVVGGIGLYTGLLPGGGSFAITIVPAIFGAAVIALVASAQFVRAGGGDSGRVRRVLAPVGQGVRDARRLLRTGNAGLLGALMWWGFDIAVLWACFNAFGEAPSFAVITVAYLVGMLANTLPLPGGVGGVDGGMVGALLAFGVEPELALIAVLAYRGFAFWLPIAPGALAYVGLRRTVARWEREDAGEAEPSRGRYDPGHGRLRRLLQRSRFPEAPPGHGGADAGCPEPRLGGQRHQARRRHDGGGDRPHQRPGHDRAAGPADPRGDGDRLPRGGHPGARGARGPQLTLAACSPRGRAPVRDRPP